MQQQEGWLSILNIIDTFTLEGNKTEAQFKNTGEKMQVV